MWCRDKKTVSIAIPLQGSCKIFVRQNLQRHYWKPAGKTGTPLSIHRKGVNAKHTHSCHRRNLGLYSCGLVDCQVVRSHPARRSANCMINMCHSFIHFLRSPVNTCRPRQNGRHFPDDIFKWIFLNDNEKISIEISLKLVWKVPIYNIPALVQITAWLRPGDKLLFEPLLVCFTDAYMRDSAPMS